MAITTSGPPARDEGPDVGPLLFAVLQQQIANVSTLTAISLGQALRRGAWSDLDPTQQEAIRRAGRAFLKGRQP